MGDKVMAQAQKHTVTLTRQLQNEIADLTGNANQFDLRVQQVGNRQYFDVIWGGRFTAQYKSRKEAHEWVMNQIELHKTLIQQAA
jgi:hypothetical protein